MNDSCKNFYPKTVSYLVVLGAFTYLFIMAYITRSYVMDDAYIGFRYIDNFVSGNGFVFNPTERVEGVTNIGWLLLLAPFSFFLEVPIAAKIVGLLLVVLTVILVYLIALRLVEDKFDYIFALPLPLLIVTQYDYLYFSLTGMETAMLSALLCLVVYFVLIDRYRLLCALLASFAFLVHPECILIYPLALLIDLRFNVNRWKENIVPIVVFAGSIIGYTLVRYFYFGSILPNTFYAKPASLKYVIGGFITFFNSSNWNIPAPFNGLLIVLLFFFGIKSFWNKFHMPAVYMMAIVLVGIGFCIYSRLDWTKLGRYFAPYIPIAFIPFWKGLIEIHKKLFSGLISARNLAKLIIIYALIIVGCNLLATHRNLGQARANTYPGFVLTSKVLVEPSLWMRDNLPDEAIIAARRIGALSYYAKKNIFDYKFGLTNREIAQLVTEHKRHFEVPCDAVLESIWKQVSPDYILEDISIIDKIVRETKGSRERFEVHSIPYRVIRSFATTQEWTLCERIQP